VSYAIRHENQVTFGLSPKEALRRVRAMISDGATGFVILGPDGEPVSLHTLDQVIRGMLPEDR
jgi:hypothetical protein